MPKIVKTARGSLIDFDLFRIKQQIASVPKPTTVKAREDFIDQKFKRRLKKLKRDVVNTINNPDSTIPITETITETTQPESE